MVLKTKSVLGLLEKPCEKMPHYMFCPRKKIISQTFKISGTLIVNLPKVHLAMESMSTVFFKELFRMISRFVKDDCKRKRTPYQPPGFIRPWPENK
jgi:hypothetical protein